MDRKTIERRIAEGLVEFGYPDATSEMVSDCIDAVNDGKSDHEMPHGIIGRFAFSQIQEINEIDASLLAAT